ncbi:YncE family protein [Streptomyces sp. NPDC048527]|uniref:YncE family protein n=1 Tax=Streptomyces sp. NPDC048527 TaxID=3365568 RepID=UPI0037192CFF
MEVDIPMNSGRTHWPRPLLVLATALLLVGAAATGAILLTRDRTPSVTALPLKRAAELTLPGDSSRFDYASLDAQRGLLFIAHLGASEVIEVDVRANRVVRTITGLSDVHGVLVVPALHRVYATATGTNEMVTLDENTGAVLHRTPTGNYPDGLAYDPKRNTVWTTNETGGSETGIDAATGEVRGTVPLGGEAGNNAYDPATGTLLADVQTRNELAVINPATLTVTRRIPLPGCDHPHGLTLDTTDRLAFIACDGNARLLTLDLATWQTTDTSETGPDPDVLAYDPGPHLLYVAAESGWLTTLDVHGQHPTVTGRAHLADGAHIVAVDPATHRSYYPVPHGNGGHPALIAYQPTH